MALAILALGFHTWMESGWIGCLNMKLRSDALYHLSFCAFYDVMSRWTM